MNKKRSQLSNLSEEELAQLLKFWNIKQNRTKKYIAEIKKAIKIKKNEQ